MGNLVGSPLDFYVQKQIELRQFVLGNNPNYLDLSQRVLFNHNKNAWVRLSSSVNLTKKNAIEDLDSDLPIGDNLAKNFTLFAGITSIDEGVKKLKGGVVPNNTLPLIEASKYSYGFGRGDDRITPPPGLGAVKIRHLNRGAIRKFDIKIKIQNSDQMSLIEGLYLRLGYYMLLEWGHTNYIDSTETFITNPQVKTPALEKFFSSDKSKDTDIENAILSHRVDTGGNYDGALFKVDNFSWNINPDGTYDVTLTGVSKGGLIDSLTIGTPGIFGENQTPIEDYIIVNPSKEEKKDILGKFSPSINVPEDGDVNKIYLETIGGKLANGEYEFLKQIGAIQEKDPSSISLPDTLDVSKAFDSSDDDNSITILDQNKSTLNQILFSLIKELKKQPWEKDSNGVNRYKRYKLRPSLLQSLDISDLNELVSLSFNNPGKDNAYEYNYITLGSLLSIIKEKVLPTTIKISDGYNDNYMFSHWFQHSTNPEVCLVPFDINQNIVDTSILNEILSTTFKVKGEGDEKFQGRLMSIHVNTEFIAKTLRETSSEDGNINLYSFLDAIMYGIQEALGNLNNFNVTYDDINGLNIKDDTVIPSLPNSAENPTFGEKEVLLRVYGTRPQVEGSFVRNISAQSKVTGKMATQIAIGSTASGNSINNSTSLLARWNEGLVDRIQLEDPKVQQQTNTDNNVLKQEIEKKYQSQLNFIQETYIDFKFGGTSTFSTAQTNLQTLLEYDLAVKTLNGNIAGKGFIPIDLTIELDGISGILLNQKISITEDLLPKSYSNKVDFIVTAIDHTVTNNEWTTTLNTLSVPKKSDKSKNFKAKDNSEFSLLQPSTTTE